MNDVLINIFMCAVGLIFAIFHKPFGKYTVKFRKKTSGGLFGEKNYGSTAVMLTQYGFLIAGLFIFLVGILKVLSKI